MIDRSAVNRALAKALAYHGCGQPEKARAWAGRLVELLECASILDATPDSGSWRSQMLLMQLKGEMKL